MRYLARGVLALLLGSVSVGAGEPASFPPTYTFTVKDGLITRVDVSEEQVRIEFKGRWATDVPGAGAAKTDDNAVVFMRRPGAGEEWKILGQEATSLLHQRARIIVKSDLWMIRGGLPFFAVPSAMVAIVPAEVKGGE